MVEAVRHGTSQREVARRCNVPLSTVQYWLKRAGSKRLDRVDFGTQCSRPRRVANRTSEEVEHMVLTLRGELAEHSDLGEYGAEAIHRRMLELQYDDVPSVGTINRILERHGTFDRHRRVRRPAPRAGWYLADLLGGVAELDEVDIVEGLHIKGGPEVEVLNVISLHGALVGAWPVAVSVTAT